MTEEQIKQTSKITEFARNMVKQSNYPIDLQDHIIATCMVVVTEATKELEKENAELKEINTHTLSQLNLDNGELITKLTKAKELLKRCYDNYIYLQPLRDDIEQFLSEEEK